MWRTFLGCELEEEIFQGRSCTIYRASRVKDGARVILKILSHPYPRPSQIAWFRREHEILRRLDSKAIVRSLAVGNEELRWGMVLEDTGGESLAQLTKRRRFSIPEVLVIAIEVCAAIEHAHERNVIHKDVNPSNIVVNPVTHRTQLIDFGIATVLSSESAPLCNPEVLEGTLSYMSPEQTGRMNRVIDSRTDLYSLGATLYELLTGQLPFPMTDPMELVHAHIALSPRPPSEIRPELEGALSDIVLKLMSKNAEDRYSSATSLRLDLEELQRRLTKGEGAETLALDTRRVKPTFQLPQKLYGRERQIEWLLSAFDRTRGGATELLLISGYSGIGKSALVQEIYRPITRERGYFVSGKFDQLKRDIPYAPIVQALSSLLRQWLTESPERVASWREELKRALGAGAGALTQVLPELSLLVGDTPPAVELSPVEAQIRFHSTLDGLIGVVARPEHPLVLFLDDLQWVDPASLLLLKQMLLSPERGHLLVIGAYRDNEVTAAHPLLLTIDEIRKSGARVSDVVLSPLDLSNLAELLGDTLRAKPAETLPLAELVFQKTEGNPFFVREFLKSLHAAGLLVPASGQRSAGFGWDLARIKSAQITDNVVELMAAKIGDFPPQTQKALQLAGAIGNQIDLRSLARVHGRSLRETAADLWPALEAGLILPLDEEYQLAAVEVEGLEESLVVRYRFAHDRIQQAAYQRIVPAERAAVHYRIGQLLYAGAAPGEREALLFDITGHLNAGIECAKTESAKLDLAELNLKAALRAKASAAFRAVNEHAQTGFSLLGANPFEKHYSLALTLADEAAESAYVINDYEQMDLWIERVLTSAKSDLDTLRVHETRIVAMNARHAPSKAIETARSFLARVGVTFPGEVTMEHVGSELTRTREVLGKKRVRDLESMADMAEPRVASAVRIMTKVYSSAYIASPLLFIVMVLTQARMVAQHGNTAASPLVYGVYGLLLAGLADDVRMAYEYGRLADRLKERPDAAPFRAQATHLFNCHTRFWAEHVRECSRGEARAYEIGLETGELEYGCYGAHVSSKYAFMAGAELSELLARMGKYSDAMRRHGQHIAWTSHASWEQAAHNLRLGEDSPWELRGPVFDEKEMFPDLLASNDRMAMSNALLCKLVLAVLFGRPKEAVAVSDEGAGYLDSVMSQMDVPLHTFYDALARLALADPGTKESRALLKRTAQTEKKLKKWARRSPENFAHKHTLIEAERARVKGDEPAARELYDRAAALARKHGFVNEEALVHEVAARFYQERGQPELSRHYLRDAHYAYLRWGAKAKVRHIESLMPELVEAPSSGGLGKGSVALNVTVTGTGHHASGALDMGTVLKASQAIAGQVVLSELLTKLMRIVIENAGAQRGALLLEKAGELLPHAEGEVGKDEIVVYLADELRRGDVPRTIVRYVARTGDVVVLDRASEDERFASDPYIERERPKSVLCLSIVNQGKLVGALYLENKDANGAFTPARVELLSLLSGQIAVSIDNARLYETLEHKVEERTRELEVRNRFIRETFGRYLSDEIVKSLLEMPEGLSLGGAKRTVTLMMTDLRGFTSISETLPAEKVVMLLNMYLSKMTELVMKHGGTIDELIGDGILAVFGAPLWQPNHAEKAIACALEMQLSMKEVNQRLKEAGLPAVSMGIGLNTGEVVLGNIGSERRTKYGVIGASVNLASRVESYTVGGQVLCTETTRNAVPAELRIDSTLVVHPKGVKEPITIFEIGAIGEPYGLSLPETAEQLAELHRPIEINFTVLRGKDTIGEVLTGAIVGLSEKKALITCKISLPPLSDLRIFNLRVGSIKVSADVYGKISPKKPPRAQSLLVTLTSVPEPARELFTKVLAQLPEGAA